MNLLVELKKLKDLSPSERQVVEFILNNPTAVVNLGIVDLAQKSFTSSSTVMRVCKRAGINSFIDFRTRLAQDYCEYLESDITTAKQAEITRESSISDIIDINTANNAHAVTSIRVMNSPELISKVVNMMSAASQWDFYGEGISNLVCQDAVFKAMRLGVRATSYTYPSQSAILSKTSTKDHLAFFVSYTGQTTQVLSLADNIRQIGVPSVSITSQTDNDLLELCEVNLFVDSFESVYRVGGMSSRISMLHLFDILFSVYINEHFDSCNNMIEKTFIADTFGKVYRKNIL